MDFLYQNTSLVSPKEILKEAERLTPYIRNLQTVVRENNYNYDESFINLLFDKALLEDILKLKNKEISNQLKYVIDIGIGGSNLGTKAIYDALYGYFDLVEPRRFPKLIFVDTNDPAFLVRLQKFLKNEIKSSPEILVVVVSKSGTTTETIVNLEILMKSFPWARERLVVISVPDSPLIKKAREKNLADFPIPKKIVGRFSVFSAVALFPLSVIGLEIQGLHEGAQSMCQQCLKEDIFKNPAALSSMIIYLHFRKGKKINDNFFFHPELESLGKWYRQLIAESLGKEKNLKGEVVNLGITPTVSIGSTDLHSMGQLYLGGPRDKLTTFIWGKHLEDAPRVPLSVSFKGILEGIEGKESTEIIRAILEGVKLAYQKKELPFTEVVLPDLSLYSLGEFMQFKMMEVLFLGKLLNVNVFDQPQVELYKKETQRILRAR